MMKDLFEEIISDMLTIQNGSTNFDIILELSNGNHVTTKHSFLIIEDRYLRITQTSEYSNANIYVLYQDIVIICNKDLTY